MCKECDNTRKTSYLRRKSAEIGTNYRINTLDARELKAAGLKHCPGCKRARSFDEFSTSGESNGGLASHCRECSRRMSRENYDKAKAGRKYRASADKIRDKRLRAKFGISLAEYRDKLIEQGAICPGCGATPEMNGKDFAVDHNHSTGEIRGLLCGRCNSAIGFLRENENIALNIIQYLRRWNGVPLN